MSGLDEPLVKPRTALTRRRAISGALGVVGAGLCGGNPLAAALLRPTPAQTAGPFYPAIKPLDADSDLVRVAGRSEPAAGIVTHVGGRILDPSGRPLAGALVEIWQCDSLGVYHHPQDGGGDPNFQGYGHTVVGSDGVYRFRTIRPVPYPGRTPHIHFAVTAPSAGRFTTQMYVAGDPGNDRDFILRSIRDPEARARVIVPLNPAADFEPDALAGTFDIVLAFG